MADPFSSRRCFLSLLRVRQGRGEARRAPKPKPKKFIDVSGVLPASPCGCRVLPAPRHLGPRERYLGWSPEVRRQIINHIAYNTRHLILPSVELGHLVSHLLWRMARVLSHEWQTVYGHPVYFGETLIDRSRYRSTLLPGGELAVSVAHAGLRQRRSGPSVETDFERR